MLFKLLNNILRVFTSNLRVAATSEKRHKIILPMGTALGGLPVIAKGVGNFNREPRHFREGQLFPLYTNISFRDFLQSILDIQISIHYPVKSILPYKIVRDLRYRALCDLCSFVFRVKRL